MPCWVLLHHLKYASGTRFHTGILWIAFQQSYLVVFYYCVKRSCCQTWKKLMEYKGLFYCGAFWGFYLKIGIGSPGSTLFVIDRPRNQYTLWNPYRWYSARTRLVSHLLNLPPCFTLSSCHPSSARAGPLLFILNWHIQFSCRERNSIIKQQDLSELKLCYDGGFWVSSLGPQSHPGWKSLRSDGPLF